LIDTCTTNQPANAVSPRDSEASAPAEFPPEQPEADLVADEDEYGAEELGEEEEAEAVEANGGEELMDKDAQMDGVESAEVPEGDNGVDEDELSEDGSVDIEGESEDELLDEYEAVEGEGAEGDEMEVDKPELAAGAALHKEEAMVH
jgi:histone chaperone ASF1